MPKKARVFSREMKLAAVRRMMAGESVSALARQLTSYQAQAALCMAT